MWVRVLGTVVLAVLLLGPVPLAYASPPDQTWLPGLYDNADYDEVVNVLTSTVGASDGTSAPELGPMIEVIRTLRPTERPAPDMASRSPYRLRAPPIG